MDYFKPTILGTAEEPLSLTGHIESLLYIIGCWQYLFKSAELKELVKKLRNIMTLWVAKPTLVHLEAIRFYELQSALRLFPAGGRVLELGSGTGWQAKTLDDLNYEVEALDLPSSKYKGDRVWQVNEYDGHNLPFDDNYFDVVYSSNVLEHIPHVEIFQKEIQRVLKPHGRAIHLLPSSSWRLLTNITYPLKFWMFADVHGEFARHASTEIFYFSRHWWRRLFIKAGWKIEKICGAKVLYSGTQLMDARISIRNRLRLSYCFGSACYIYVLKQDHKSG